MSAAQIPCGYITRLETRHFSFEAHGLTEAEAWQTLQRGLATHGRQCDLRDDWAAEYAESITYRPFMPGVAFRDDTEIST